MLCPKCGTELESGTGLCPNSTGEAAIPAQAAPVQPGITIGGYLVMFLLQLIPVVGIVLLFIWAFGSSDTPKKNYARAALIFTLIAVILLGAFCAAFGAAFYSAATGY